MVHAGTTNDALIETNEKLPKALVVDDNTEMIIYLKEIFSNFLDCTFAFDYIHIYISIYYCIWLLLVCSLVRPFNRQPCKENHFLRLV